MQGTFGSALAIHSLAPPPPPPPPPRRRARAGSTREAAREVWLAGDDAPLDARDMLARLAAIVARSDVTDSYLRGGAVEELEVSFAELLGKEACALMPTGTLANTIAVRLLCGDQPRAMCQYDSHLYLDESDASQRLSSINLVPVGKGLAAPPLEEVADAFNSAEKGPYPLRFGSISLESPVRRLDGEMIPTSRIMQIAGIAANHGVPMHLDGARVLLARRPFDVRAYVAPFETVYVSLYKYLGAPFGAVLAGPGQRIKAIRDQRHLFGGLIYQGWITAVLALDRLRTHRLEMDKVYATADAVVSALQRSGLRVRSNTNGSNIFLFEMPEELAVRARERGKATGIILGEWRTGVLRLVVNRTILRRPVSEYVRLFLD